MSVEDLIVYNKINDLVLNIYEITSEFPEEEKYALTSQMRRAVISIGSNLMEGNYRGSRKDFIHFIDISKGSLAELKYQIYLSFKLSYIDKKIFSDYENRILEIMKMLSSLQSSLRES